MTITLAGLLKVNFAKEAKADPMWTIPEIEEWLKKKKEFLEARLLAETSGGFQKSQRVSSKTYQLQDGSVIRLSDDGIEEVNL